MKKDKPTTFNVQKRFTLWVEMPVVAATMHEAVDKAEKLRPQDFLEIDHGASLCDWEPLPGTSVGESW